VNDVCYEPLEASVTNPCEVCDVYTEQMLYQVCKYEYQRTAKLKPFSVRSMSSVSFCYISSASFRPFF